MEDAADILSVRLVEEQNLLRLFLVDRAAAILEQADHVLVVHGDYFEHLASLEHLTVSGEGVSRLLLAIVKLVRLSHLPK